MSLTFKPVAAPRERPWLCEQHANQVSLPRSRPFRRWSATGTRRWCGLTPH